MGCLGGLVLWLGRPALRSLLKAPAGERFGEVVALGAADAMTTALIKQIDPDVVFTAGDNAYEDGELEEFENYCKPTWVRFESTASGNRRRSHAARLHDPLGRLLLEGEMSLGDAVDETGIAPERPGLVHP